MSSTNPTGAMTPAQQDRLRFEANRLRELAAALAAASEAKDWTAVADAAREGEAITCRTRRLAARNA